MRIKAIKNTEQNVYAKLYIYIISFCTAYARARASNAASDILLMEVISQPRAFPLGMAIFFATRKTELQSKSQSRMDLSSIWRRKAPRWYLGK